MSKLLFATLLLMLFAPIAAAQDSFEVATPQNVEDLTDSSDQTDDSFDLGDDELERLLNLDIEQLQNVKVTNPVVYAASKTAEKASDAPSTVYVINKEDIRKRGYATLTDVLRDVPGLETVENYFSEIGTLVPIRGVVGNNKFIVLINV